MTCTDKPESSDAASDGNPTRRDFLGHVSNLTVAGTAASVGAGVSVDAAETNPNLLPTIQLGHTASDSVDFGR